ncbi:hypothetical protein ACIOEZ_01030 [Streptomyces sp. NPDC087866]|uniref:hypothetical protein n=1 Tax=unclassified Streptomyces TaxID=2593676 RepID=UPI0033BA8DC7
MLRHAISPSYGYVKAAHDIVRHSRLSSDAKLLILYVQGLPERRTGEALSDHAKKLGIKGRAYQKAKGQLKEAGFVHEWRRQGERGLWVTDQLFSNVPLTDEEARRCREAETRAVPGERLPAVGDPGSRPVGGHPPAVEDCGENYPHPPSEAPASAPARPEPEEPADELAPPDAEVAVAESVLASLRHASPQLHLGVREARSLAGAAADWLRRGVKAAELRLALVSELPADGVRSAYGFVRHRLVQKLPEVPVPAAPVVAPRQPVPCEGDGPEHVFRPRADQTVCGPCARRTAEEAHFAKWPPRGPAEGPGAPERVPWRERVEAIRAQGAEAR